MFYNTSHKSKNQKQMTTTIYTSLGAKQFNIDYSYFKNKGQWSINAEINYEVGNTIYRTTYQHQTKDLVFINKILDMQAQDQLDEDIEMEYHNTFFTHFQESIFEFILRYSN